MPNKDPAWAWMKWMDGIAGAATSGTPYFVDSDNGDDDYDGLTWNRAKQTIQAAVDLVDDHDTIYIRGVFTEAVTTATDDPDVKLIGVSDGMISPAWLSGATGSSALTLRSLNWQVANIYFQGAGNTVPLIHVRRDGSNLATGTVIVNCSFHGVGGSHSAICLDGGVVQAKIYGCRFAEFYGVAHGDAGNNYEATIWGTNYTQSAVHVDIIGNHFVDNLDNIKLQAIGCNVRNNTFSKTGLLSDTTTVLNLICGGGSVGGNIVAGNYFDQTSAEMTRANGYYFSTTDAVSGNHCLDGEYPRTGPESNNFYVDSATGNVLNSGLSWGQAKATIQQGVDLMTDHSTLYVGGVAYTEAVTLPVGIERGKIIGVCKANQIPFWQSGAVDAVHLTINRGEWEVANFRFFSSVATVAHVTISKAGGSAVIRDCWFSGNGSESGIEAVGPGGAPTDIKILRNRFSGFVTTNALEGAICGTNYDDSGAVVWEIIGNMFADNTKNINLLAHSCRIEGNTFTTTATADAMTVIISTRAGVGAIGAGGGNAVVGNYFPHATTELITANGYLASTNDVWAGNYCTDGISAFGGFTTMELVPGRTYSLVKTDGVAGDDDLFEVVGGAISITSLVGYIDVDIGAACTMTIELDHVDQDFEFTDAVDIQAGVDGGRIIFSNANVSTLTLLGIGNDTGSTSLHMPWFCPAGMLESDSSDADTSGNIRWYMTFIPLEEGVSVTVQ
jgi:hypothetical protein